ncbi:serine carboxypeptidase-like 18 [Citrus sinensis]|nr:serine carboxypeptidase-like 18 [Citrus sinensis]
MAALQLFILCVVLNMVLSSSQQIITTLPGFDGDLPFKLETGYIGVGQNDDVQLFYYFIESERSPEDDPLVLWLSGGPGCSGFSGLVFEIGPLSFDYEKSKVNLPKFLLNPYSWTKVANIIFLDAPVGTGFSYANTWQGYIMNDTLSAAQNYYFLRKWLIAHPSFLANPLYIGGDSYSGIIVPMIVQHISDGIDVGHRPRMNLKGYLLGNPLTDSTENQNSVPHFAYLNALISHEIYEVNSLFISTFQNFISFYSFQSAKRNCQGEYVNVDPSNGLCIADLENITECISRVNHAQIYEPSCRGPFISPRRKLFNWNRSIIEEDSLDFLSSPTQPAASGTWCRFHNYVYSYIWANDKTVQRAIGVQEGTVKYWVRCNQSLSYTKDVSSSLAYHRNLIKKGYQVLIYSGDVDMKVPYVATEAWIKSLNLTIETGWQPWFVEGQVAGEQVIQLQSTNLRSVLE